MAKLSVVVPTYNRGAKLALMLDRLLTAELGGWPAPEIIVVDDGSAVAAATFAPEPRVTRRFSLRFLRQANAGPASARNAGFRASTGDLVIFVDDDILIPQDLLRGHVRAHELNPGSVIFGRCPYDCAPTAFTRYLDSLANDPGRVIDQEFVPLDAVASGHISVERRTFQSEGRVYREDLANPSAEELELAWRLRARGVPMLLAPRLVAVHDQPATLDALCRQQYKYGIGCAETWQKCPEARAMPQLRTIMGRSGPAARADLTLPALRRRLKGAAAVRPMRSALLAAADRLQGVLSDGRLLYAAFSLAIGAHFAGGIREGLRRYRPA